MGMQRYIMLTWNGSTLVPVGRTEAKSLDRRNSRLSGMESTSNSTKIFSSFWLLFLFFDLPFLRCISASFNFKVTFVISNPSHFWSYLNRLNIRDKFKNSKTTSLYLQQSTHFHTLVHKIDIAKWIVHRTQILRGIKFLTRY